MTKDLMKVTQGKLNRMTSEERDKFYKNLLAFWSMEPEGQVEYQKDWEEDQKGDYR